MTPRLPSTQGISRVYREHFENSVPLPKRLSVLSEPTDAMLIAGLEAAQRTQGTLAQMRACWDAMLRKSIEANRRKPKPRSVKRKSKARRAK